MSNATNNSAPKSPLGDRAWFKWTITDDLGVVVDKGQARAPQELSLTGYLFAHKVKKLLKKNPLSAYVIDVQPLGPAI